jgi:hypothetical protein
LKQHNNSRKNSELTSKRAKSRGPVQRDTKEVLAELVEKLKEKLDPKKVAATSAGEKHPSGELRPNLDRLTVGVDLGDQGSHYCILGLEGETLAEGQLRTTQEDLASFFQGLNGARVVVEVGTHSAWVQEVIRGCGHEVLVANPRLMDGSKRRSCSSRVGYPPVLSSGWPADQKFPTVEIRPVKRSKPRVANSMSALKVISQPSPILMNA